MNPPMSNEPTETEEAQEKSQEFFARYALEAQKPHAGEHFQQFVRSLLNRATEAELYKPEAT